MVYPCGHTFCADCCRISRTCHICRRRLPNNYQYALNFTLVSLLEKLERVPNTETLNQQTQTDRRQDNGGRKTQVNQIQLLKDKGLTISLRNTGISLKLK